jgi:hypothetical protein
MDAQYLAIPLMAGQSQHQITQDQRSPLFDRRMTQRDSVEGKLSRQLDRYFPAKESVDPPVAPKVKRQKPAREGSNH